MHALPNASNISLKVTDTHFNVCIWSVENIDLSIVNCHLEAEQIIGMKSRLHISNTHLGSGIVTYEGIGIGIISGEATLANCTFPTNLSNPHTFIWSISSVLTLKSLKILNWQGGSFLMTVAGTSYVKDVSFVGCVATGSLLNGTLRSTQIVDNCTFLSNHGGLVHAESTSAAICAFLYENNTGFCNSSVDCPWIDCQDSFLEVANSHFIGNTMISEPGVQISGKTIAIVQKCYFQNNTQSSDFGIVHISTGAASRINNSVFISNTGGAVLFVNSSNSVISNCLFHGNAAKKGGGIGFSNVNPHWNRSRSCEDLWNRFAAQRRHVKIGQTTDMNICVENNATIVLNCTFVANLAKGGGAAIYSVATVLSLQNNIFQRNVDGAVYLTQSPTTITASIFERNNASRSGAGVWADASLFVHSSAFTGNQVASQVSGGAAIYIQMPAKTFSVSNCSFLENKGSASGGAISSYANETILQESSFYGNTAFGGGAVHCGQSFITKCTFESNSAQTSGGGLEFHSGVFVSVSLSNFSDNSAGLGGAISGTRNFSFFCDFRSFDNNRADFP